MEHTEHHRREYPLFLKILLAISFTFFGALGLLLLSMILSMVGFAYGLPDVMSATVMMEQIGIVLLGLSVIVGGGVSMLGLLIGGTSTSQTYVDEQQEKLKNENRLYDIREHGLTVEDVLADMSMTERELLAEKLAESRLAIREDGVLIPLEQAEKLQKIERYMNG